MRGAAKAPEATPDDVRRDLLAAGLAEQAEHGYLPWLQMSDWKRRTVPNMLAYYTERFGLAPASFFWKHDAREPWLGPIERRG